MRLTQSSVEREENRKGGGGARGTRTRRVPPLNECSNEHVAYVLPDLGDQLIDRLRLSRIYPTDPDISVSRIAFIARRGLGAGRKLGSSRNHAGSRDRAHSSPLSSGEFEYLRIPEARRS